ncbi:MAG: TlpA family protein disulfide reductase [Ignavibacteriales bacterium]|nr:TlpA family protein disulfide reductase [Ignavibacteriales bacterium]
MSRLLSLIGLFLLVITFNTQSQEVKTIDEKGLSNLLKNRDGSILFINFWATWCVPCREEFPDIVKLAKNFPKVEYVAVSLDHPDEIKSKIEPFLKKMKAPFNNYVAKFKDDQVLIEMINKDWNGAIPATAIYSSNGKEVGFYPKKMSYTELEKELKKVIK